MWHTIYHTKYNFFTVVVQQLANAPIYKLTARRLGLGIYSPILSPVFPTVGEGRARLFYGDWQVALMSFCQVLGQYNAPLTLYTGDKLNIRTANRDDYMGGGRYG